MPGTVYVIGCDGPERYVGSTETSIQERWYSHCSIGNHCLSKAIIDKYGPDCCWIEPLEEVADETLLLERERHWIENTPGCVNKKLPGRTDAEYRLDTVEHRREYNKAWYAALTPEQREARRARNTEAERRRYHERRAKLKAPPSV